jgi:hypothetical protein
MNTKNTTALIITSALAGGAAHGAIVYTNYNNLVIDGRDGAAEFDVSPDFNSHYFLLYQDSNSQKPEVRGDGINSFVLARTWQDTNNMDLNNRTYGGLPLTLGGVIVNSQMQDVNAAKQQNGITSLTIQTNGYFNERPDNNDDDTGGSKSMYDIGDWGNTTTNTAYVGLVMVNGAITNFAWVHFTWSDPSSSSQDSTVQLTLIDGAYESAPNIGIPTSAGTTNLPIVLNVPGSVTTYSGASFQLPAQVDYALGYQWQAGPVGSGVYTNLSDGGLISGSSTSVLTIKSATPAATADYVLVATNYAGAVTSSPPATVTILPPGPTPTTANGWFNAFQAQADMVYAGGQQNVSYQAANGKVYWLFNNLAEGTMDPTSDAFNSNVTLLDNKILLESGDSRVPTDLTPSAVDSLPTDSATYYFKDMFEANGNAYALLQKTDPFTHLNSLGSALAKYNIDSSGALAFLGYDATPASLADGGTNVVDIQWADSAVVQNGFVYFFGEHQPTDGIDSDGTFLARVPTANVENPNDWTFWNGTAWDVNETNVVPVITNSVSVVRLYNGAWVAVNKVLGMSGTNTYAYAAAEPQGPYTQQLLFTDPTPDAIGGVGTTTNSATGVDEYYYSVNPALHPEYPLNSGKLLVSIDYWDYSSSNYNIDDAGLFKPRFYEVTLTGLPVVISIQKVGANVVLNWSSGLLLQAPSLAGPWTTNSATSPYTLSPAGTSQMFYRVLAQ